MKLITSLEDAKSWIESGSAEPATLMALDLTPLDDAFSKANLAGSAFLGCTVAET